MRRAAKRIRLNQHTHTHNHTGPHHQLLLAPACPQVRVTLPVDALTATDNCARLLVLELWAAGCLVSSTSAVLLPACHACAASELHAWMGRGGGAGLAVGPSSPAGACSLSPSGAAFLEDLVLWLHLRAALGGGGMPSALATAEWGAAAATEGAAGRQAEGMCGDTQWRMVAEPDLVGVGRDLLDHCLDLGLVDVAGEERETIKGRCWQGACAVFLCVLTWLGWNGGGPLGMKHRLGSVQVQL